MTAAHNIFQQNITARCYYVWSGIETFIAETDTDVILGWEEFGSSSSNRYSNNSVHVAPGGAEHTRWNTHQDNKEGSTTSSHVSVVAVAVAEAVAVADAVAVVRLWLVVVACFFVVGCGGGCVGGCAFVWRVLCDVPLRRCVVVCRVVSSSLSLVLSSLCVVVPCRS